MSKNLSSSASVTPALLDAKQVCTRKAILRCNMSFSSLSATQRVWALRTCGVLVHTVKKMTTLETTARASCDQKLIQLMRLRVAHPRQAQSN